MKCKHPMCASCVRCYEMPLRPELGAPVQADITSATCAWTSWNGQEVGVAFAFPDFTKALFRANTYSRSMLSLNLETAATPVSCDQQLATQTLTKSGKLP